ncbi:hypothetical protein HNR42_000099 [Deinobacterium chartae]|uniref:DUF1349 domain-containing protein n=1 Tax=Deinobacterium chartae TaxID=521158 RepID=A0A841HTK7_9DEIO|nr:DUF1349 domain-containing protein [Deinobacterium chartae]MBB6096687.1 hypothetical protein [Deinobacterium chartae]
MIWTWLNEAPHWHEDGSRLTVRSGPDSDFWRHTHYGFVRDSGHARLTVMRGDFDATVRFRGDYRDLYDQAGLLLRLDPERWIKCGVEYVEGRQLLSVVVTHGFSDWSVTPLEGQPEEITLRLERRAEAVTVLAAPSGQAPQMLRMAYFPPEPEVEVGPMCASPQGQGFEVSFEEVRLEAVT